MINHDADPAPTPHDPSELGRVRIWDQATNLVIYDNLAGTGDDAGLGDATIIQGGGIVVPKVQ